MGRIHKLLVGQEYWLTLVKDIKSAKESINASLYVVGIKRTQGIPYMLEIKKRLEDKIKEGLEVEIWVNITSHTPAKNTLALQFFGGSAFSGHLHQYRVGQYHHEKIFVIDSRIVYLGSHNFSSTSLASAYEVSARLDSPADASIILSYLKKWRN